MVKSLMADHLSGCAQSMTVREFRKFCNHKDIILKNSQTGLIYRKQDNYLERKITGVYLNIAGWIGQCMINIARF